MLFDQEANDRHLQGILNWLFRLVELSGVSSHNLQCSFEAILLVEIVKLCNKKYSIYQKCLTRAYV